MPTNVAQGNAVTFILGFKDASGNQTLGLGAVFSITQNGSIIFTHTLAYSDRIGFMFTVTWQSAGAALGAATYAVTLNGGTIATGDPNLRITSPNLIL